MGVFFVSYRAKGLEPPPLAEWALRMPQSKKKADAQRNAWVESPAVASKKTNPKRYRVGLSAFAGKIRCSTVNSCISKETKGMERFAFLQ